MVAVLTDISRRGDDSDPLVAELVPTEGVYVAPCRPDSMWHSPATPCLAPEGDVPAGGGLGNDGTIFDNVPSMDVPMLAIVPIRRTIRVRDSDERMSSCPGPGPPSLGSCPGGSGYQFV